MLKRARERLAREHQREYPYHAACLKGEVALFKRTQKERLEAFKHAWMQVFDSKELDRLADEALAHEQVDQQDNKGRTLLHCAVVGKNAQLVTYLLAHRPMLSARDNNEKTPLQCALESKQHLVVDEMETALRDQLPEKIECQVCMQEKHRDGIALNSECCQNPAVCYQCVHKTVRENGALVCPLCRAGERDASPRLQRGNITQCPIS